MALVGAFLFVRCIAAAGDLTAAFSLTRVVEVAYAIVCLVLGIGRFKPEVVTIANTAC